jgi:energy-coupling factor transporter ATP-binding protein EcfA2
MAIIETTNLTYTYPGGTKPSISDVSVRIEKGEFTLVTGPSGCGKTTLCRCFNGLIPHFYQGEMKGEIIVAGLNVSEHPTYELAQHLGLVFQNPENQLFALSVEKDVYDLRERAPHELSGGQQQRVAIASVLAMKPEVIVLDEPTSFLDPLSARRIFEVIHELNRNLGITVVLVEHRLDLTAKYADHIIVMDKGKVLLDGEPHEILKSEEARLVGVGIPKATRLYQLLMKDGAKLRDVVPLSSDDMANSLKEALGSR